MESERSTESIRAVLTADRAAADPRDEVRYAVLAHPAVQLVRFLSKYILVWYVDAAVFGRVAFAGLLAFGMSQAAVFGLDAAVVYAPSLGGGLLRKLRRFHLASGLAVAALFAAAAPLVDSLAGDPHDGIGTRMLWLAPLVFIQCQGAIPVAVLVRGRRYRDLFVIDICGILGLAVVTVGLAAAGLGARSLILGWYANAFVNLLLSMRFARADLAAAGRDGAPLRPVIAYGARAGGAGLYAYVSERVDSLGVGTWLGNAAIGVYEMGLHVSQPLINYAVSLSDRYLFPSMTVRRETARIAPLFLLSVRHALAVWVPPHLALALLAAPFTETLMDPSWRPVQALLVVLPVVAAVRCVSLLPAVAFKAAGRARLALYLSAIETLLVGASLAFTVSRSVEAVAAGVLLARAAGMAISLGAGLAVFRVRPAAMLQVIAPALIGLAAWTGAFWLGLAAIERLPAGPPVRLLGGAVLAVVLWLAARWTFDRHGFAFEWRCLRGRLPAPLQVLPESGGAPVA